MRILDRIHYVRNERIRVLGDFKILVNISETTDGEVKVMKKEKLSIKEEGKKQKERTDK